MDRRRALFVSILSLLLAVDSAQAGHQSVLGSKFAVKDPQPAGDASKRQWSVQVKELESPATIAGDPTTHGANVSVFTEGTTSTSQSWSLPQGVSASGKPLWKATAKGFVYSDPDAINGPVKSLKISRSAGGTLQVKAKASAKIGSIDIAPPNTGTRACVRLDLGGGDSYHVLFGADASIDKNDAKQFLASAPASKGLCCDLESSPPCCPASCPASDGCHTEGSCDPIDGICSDPARSDGSTCDTGIDNAPVTTCVGGSCETCTPSGACTCTLNTECPTGQACTNGSCTCTDGLQCASGSCTGGSCTCTDDTQCAKGQTCTDGLCVTTPRACAFDRQCVIGHCSITTTPSPRYVDNEDGTITDRQTCLVWEKKDAYDGLAAECPDSNGVMAASCADPHDADNLYSWGTTYRNGSAFSSFLAALNTSAFAGHSDWRLPATELQGLVDTMAPGCGTGEPCIGAAFENNCVPTCSGTDPTCSCTKPFGHWLSSSASVVDFFDGSTATQAGISNQAVRAVRGCTAASATSATTVKAACFNQCVINCRSVNDGDCINGCLFGQEFSVETCNLGCGGFAPSCLDSCLQTVDCITRTSGVEGACNPL
jgi:hypothetical protein